MTSRLALILPFVAALGSAALLFPANAGAQQANHDQPAMDAAGPMDDDGPMGMDHRMGMDRRPTPEDRQAFLDARIAAVHAGLQLTPEQEKLWPPVESAIRDSISQMREAWRKMKAGSGGMEKPDPIARMRRMAEMSTLVAQNLNKVADAAQPLYAALSDDQKWRLHVLLRAMHMHGMHGMGMMRHRWGMGGGDMMRHGEDEE